jgi:hypothetical protein
MFSMLMAARRTEDWKADYGADCGRPRGKLGTVLKREGGFLHAVWAGGPSAFGNLRDGYLWLLLSTAAIAGSEAKVCFRKLIVRTGRPLLANSSRKAVGQHNAHGRHSVRSRGFSKPDVRSKIPMTALYGLRWFEAESPGDGDAQIAAVARPRAEWVSSTLSGPSILRREGPLGANTGHSLTA